jgi:hypothetical protein
MRLSARLSTKSIASIATHQSSGRLIHNHIGEADINMKQSGEA